MTDGFILAGIVPARRGKTGKKSIESGDRAVFPSRKISKVIERYHISAILNKREKFIH